MKSFSPLCSSATHCLSSFFFFFRPASRALPSRPALSCTMVSVFLGWCFTLPPPPSHPVLGRGGGLRGGGARGEIGKLRRRHSSSQVSRRLSRPTGLGPPFFARAVPPGAPECLAMPVTGCGRACTAVKAASVDGASPHRRGSARERIGSSTAAPLLQRGQAHARTPRAPSGMTSSRQMANSGWGAGP